VRLRAAGARGQPWPARRVEVHLHDVVRRRDLVQGRGRRRHERDRRGQQIGERAVALVHDGLDEAVDVEAQRGAQLGREVVGEARPQPRTVAPCVPWME